MAKKRRIRWNKKERVREKREREERERQRREGERKRERAKQGAQTCSTFPPFSFTLDLGSTVLNLSDICAPYLTIFNEYTNHQKDTTVVLNEHFNHNLYYLF